MKQSFGSSHVFPLSPSLLVFLCLSFSLSLSLSLCLCLSISVSVCLSVCLSVSLSLSLSLSLSQVHQASASTYHTIKQILDQFHQEEPSLSSLFSYLSSICSHEKATLCIQRCICNSKFHIPTAISLYIIKIYITSS